MGNARATRRMLVATKSYVLMDNVGILHDGVTTTTTMRGDRGKNRDRRRGCNAELSQPRASAPFSAIRLLLLRPTLRLTLRLRTRARGRTNARRWRFGFLLHRLVRFPRRLFLHRRLLLLFLLLLQRVAQLYVRQENRLITL